MQELIQKTILDPSSGTSPEAPDFAELRAILIDRVDMYETLAKRAGFSISFSGKVTGFDHSSNTIIISLSQLHELGIHSVAERDFIVLHETGHLKEYLEDPEGYLKIIEDCKAKKELSKVYFSLNNCLADVYVNTNTRNVAPEYEGVDGFSDSVKQLYRDKAFKKRDFSELPRCVQFRSYLLNLGMGVGEDIKLSPDVAEVIQAGTKLLGEAISFKELLETYYVPAIGKRRSDDWKGTAGERYFITKQAILPAFERLLELDIKEKRDLNQKGNALETVELDLDGAEAVIREILKAAKEANLTPQEKAEREQARQASDIAKASGLNEEQAKDFAERLLRLQPVINQIVSNLKQLQAPAEVWKQVKEGHYRDGNELDVEYAIENFGRILKLPEQARVMLRDHYSRATDLQPSKIRLWLVLDLSGSMDDDLEELKDLTVSLTAAMATLSLETELADGNLNGELGVFGYANDYEEIISPRPSPTLDDAARAFSKIRANGGTREYTALNAVLERFVELKEKDTADATNCLDILIGITDGDTENPHLSIAALDQLSDKGMALVKGVKILRGASTERGKEGEAGIETSENISKDRGSDFEKVWIRSSGKRSGSYVQSAKGLPYVIRRMIEDGGVGGS